MRLYDFQNGAKQLRPLGGRGSSRLGMGMAAALFVAALSGCGSAKPAKYFELTHPPTTSLSSSQAPLDAILLVRAFQSSHLYREDRIVYGSNAQQLGLYETFRWSQPPVELLQDALARGLRSSGKFKTVTTLRSDSSVQYVLTGHLYDFREVTADGVVARLNYDVELRDVKLGKTIWTHSYSHDEASSGKSVADVVAAMDKNVNRSVQESQDGILQALAADSQK